MFFNFLLQLMHIQKSWCVYTAQWIFRSQTTHVSKLRSITSSPEAHATFPPVMPAPSRAATVKQVVLTLSDPWLKRGNITLTVKAHQKRRKDQPLIKYKGKTCSRHAGDNRDSYQETEEEHGLSTSWKGRQQIPSRKWAQSQNLAIWRKCVSLCLSACALNPDKCEFIKSRSASSLWDPRSGWGLSISTFKSILGGLPWWSQWLRFHLPRQGTWVRALVWEDSTCPRATGPGRHN